MNNGMQAKDYSDWIDSNIEMNTAEKKLMESYVLGSPSSGLSWKGRSLYSYYCFQDFKDYTVLWGKMREGIADCVCVKTYVQLEEKIREHPWLTFNERPSDITETIYMYVGDYKQDQLFKEHFSDRIVKNSGKTNAERKNEADKNKKIAYVDRMLGHVRNSFAHGCYASLNQNNEIYYILQDVTKDGIISARIIVTLSRLRNWIEILEQKRRAYIEQEAV